MQNLHSTTASPSTQACIEEENTDEPHSPSQLDWADFEKSENDEADEADESDETDQSDVPFANSRAHAVADEGDEADEADEAEHTGDSEQSEDDFDDAKPLATTLSIIREESSNIAGTDSDADKQDAAGSTRPASPEETSSDEPSADSASSSEDELSASTFAIPALTHLDGRSNALLDAQTLEPARHTSRVELQADEVVGGCAATACAASLISDQPAEPAEISTSAPEVSVAMLTQPDQVAQTSTCAIL